MSSDFYNELTFYTLSHADPYFIHQNVVDAYTAQSATIHTKKIALFFALAGLYLTVEKGYSGRQVQLAHMKMANNKQMIPDLSIPGDKGALTIETVLQAPAGKLRDNIIKEWCISVWKAYSDERDTVINSTEALLKDTKSGS
jgi:hypothetical protein